ncbi:hypothetical protein OPV22_026748 [Ensete ventricosum]|uniref:Uncharacterized protein n=1 Tax=Ensete ventricosum TaxID=4639 RepID=A0AAV8Q3T3_ENSVE|nr:hypothetical protein OPV22_026748 [Ensete ventricosum]
MEFQLWIVRVCQTDISDAVSLFCEESRKSIIRRCAFLSSRKQFAGLTHPPNRRFDFQELSSAIATIGWRFSWLRNEDQSGGG